MGKTTESRPWMSSARAPSYLDHNPEGRYEQMKSTGRRRLSFPLPGLLPTHPLHHRPTTFESKEVRKEGRGGCQAQVIARSAGLWSLGRTRGRGRA
jgi:hypothetical protein